MLVRLLAALCGLALFLPAQAEWIYPMNQGKVPMVPARYVAQWLGAVMTEGKKGAVTIVLEKKTAAFTVDKTAATVQGKAVTLPAPPRTKAGLVYVPASLLTTAWGVGVEYKPEVEGLDPAMTPALITLTRGKAKLLLPQYVSFHDNQVVPVTPLQLDALNGLVSLAPKHLAGGQIDLADRLGRRPLHFAAFTEQMAMVKWLLDHKAAIDVRENYYAHLSPLSAALRMGHPDVTLLLFRQGAYADTEDLGWAARLGNAEVVKELLARVPPEAEPREIMLYHPLHEAAARGDAEIVGLLLAKGANADYNYRQTGTPLLSAVGNGHLEIVKRLLEQGVALDAPVDISKNMFIRELYGYRASRFAQFTEITPLQYAAYRGQGEVYDFLLAQGADPQAKTADGLLPLAAAAYSGKPSAVELLITLIEKGLPVNGTTDGLAIRLDCNWLDAEKIIGDKNSRRVELQLANLTPLHLAILARDTDSVVAKATLLLEHGADVNARTKLGLTPLHLALANVESYSLCQLLVKHGADVNAKTDQGLTPVTYARLFNDEVVAEYLRKKGGKE